MEKERGKYKVRLQRGFNGMRKIWKRTEESHRKWKKKGKMRRVRKTIGRKRWVSKRKYKGGKSRGNKRRRKNRGGLRAKRWNLKREIEAQNKGVSQTLHSKESDLKRISGEKKVYPKRDFTNRKSKRSKGWSRKGRKRRERKRGRIRGRTRIGRRRGRGRVLTPRKRRPMRAMLGGGVWPERGKRKGWFKKKRVGLKGRKIRYGGGQKVNKKRRRGACRNQRTKLRKVKDTSKYRKGVRGEERGTGMGSLAYTGGVVESRRKDRLRPVDHIRGKMERRADRRRWRGGRVETRRGGRARREKEEVVRLLDEKREETSSEMDVWKGYEKPGVSKVKTMKGKRRTGREEVVVGSGRKVKEERWKKLKGSRIEQQFGEKVVWINGRTVRAYVIIDYLVGVMRVRRVPRSGEVRRPGRMERSRMMRRQR